VLAQLPLLAHAGQVIATHSRMVRSVPRRDGYAASLGAVSVSVRSVSAKRESQSMIRALSLTNPASHSAC
jgi:hypothetical protein